MVRILIVDDHPLVRRGVRNLIEGRAGWEVCGEAADDRAAFLLAEQLSPDIAVIDVTLPPTSGLALAVRLRQACPAVKALLHSMIDDDEIVASALAAGVRGYVLKTDNSEHLEAAISALAAGRTYFSAAISERVQAELQGRRHNWLELFTARELEVAQLVAAGRSNKEIAKTLGISFKTVEAHRAAAMRKAEVRNAPELVRFAIKHRLIHV